MTNEERGETRLRMMTRKMEANVMRNATKQTKKNYFISLLCLIIKTFY